MMSLLGSSVAVFASENRLDRSNSMKRGVLIGEWRFCREAVIGGEAGFRGLVKTATLLVALITPLMACSNTAGGEQKLNGERGRPVVPVTIATSVEKTIPVQLLAIGKVQAFSTVVIKSQVEGEIVGVHFKEGQEVKAGDLLFTIDPRPFETSLRKAEAQLAKERAQLRNAKKLIDRYQSVIERGYVSQEQYDTAIANVAALEASVKAGEAAVEQARLELTYCDIRAPIGGYTGEIKVHQGNIMKANDNDRPMLTIKQVTPAYVSFSVPEQNLSEIKHHMTSGSLDVLARVPGNGENQVGGRLSFIDNMVDPATGMIQLKGIFSNEEKILWPGQFVHVVLTLTTRPGMVVVPSQAVQTGQEGQYVFVVKPDSTVEYRLVTAGRMIDHEVVIDKGMSPGEKVVTDGQLQLAQGSRVRIVEDGRKGSEGENR